MNRYRWGIAAAATALIANGVRAEVGDIVWNATGRYERTLAVAPGRFVELCGRLEKGQVVAWSFKSDARLTFNVHYHEGERVSFLARHDGAMRARGRLDAEVAQDYCWMWANKSASAVNVEVLLEQERR